MRSDAIPRLAAGVRLRFDDRRQVWILLAPERILLPDPIGAAILREIDGVTTVEDIVDQLHAAFDAPRELIATEVGALLDDLVSKGVLAA